ncbi:MULTISPECIES: c-type cytochrome [unclassified Variovorax]|uniref:c-type cytochrome n=1 Tax=unclassified Variovorax TaxID=663243 RepID=UPI001BD62E9B|nr:MULTISPECIES: c-type cytochrome [unclassified Variovorax]
MPPSPVLVRSVKLLAAACALTSAGIANAQDSAIPAFKTVDSMEARVQGCVTCHGQSGQGTSNEYFPRIAGKPAAYLYNQLVAFRDGKREYPPMNYLVAYLPDAYLKEIAAYFAKQRPAFEAKQQSAAGPDVLARGSTLALGGDPSKQLPACMTCHGAAFTGMEPGIPGLAGLRTSYIVAQLTRWRTGNRQAAQPDCMKRISDRLTEADVHAVATWLAAQDPPRDAVPAPANFQGMPLSCGSQKP